MDSLEACCKFDRKSIEKIESKYALPDEIQQKMVDIYNYMAETGAGVIYIQFESGIKVKYVIDASEWKNPPKVDLDKGKTTTVTLSTGDQEWYCRSQKCDICDTEFMCSKAKFCPGCGRKIVTDEEAYGK